METLNIYKRLLNIQDELKAPKNQYNGFGKYKYRSAEDILEAVKPLCVKHGVVLTISDTIKNIGERYYIESTATIRQVDNGEQIEVKAFAREEESKKGMDGSQVTGASSSYARKYALNGLFAIDDTKDSDATNNGTEPTKTAVKPAKPVEQKEAPKEVLTLAKAKALTMANTDGKQIPLDTLTNEQLEFVVSREGYADIYRDACKLILEFRNAERKN